MSPKKTNHIIESSSQNRGSPKVDSKRNLSEDVEEHTCCCSNSPNIKIKREDFCEIPTEIQSLESLEGSKSTTEDYQDRGNMKHVRSIKKFVGAHVSAAGGVHNAFSNSSDINGKAFALFLKNQRRWESTPYTEKQISLFKKSLVASGMSSGLILPHGSYLINLGNPDMDKRAKSMDSFIDDIKRCSLLGLDLYNLHPGSTVGACSVKRSIELIAKGINEAHNLVPNVVIVLETMAGQGNCVGNRFEDIRDIIELIDDKSRVGVCIDTCHIFAAGYDIRSKASYVKTMEKFDSIIGFKYLRAVHLNDSKSALGSGVDRHENIGKGHIGIEAFKHLMNDSRFDGIPIVLETPVPPSQSEVEVYSSEIKLLYDLIE
jgi:apurinic endonuclease APN1